MSITEYEYMTVQTHWLLMAHLQELRSLWGQPWSRQAGGVYKSVKKLWWNYQNSGLIFKLTFLWPDVITISMTIGRRKVGLTGSSLRLYFSQDFTKTVIASIQTKDTRLPRFTTCPEDWLIDWLIDQGSALWGHWPGSRFGKHLQLWFKGRSPWCVQLLPGDGHLVRSGLPM